MKSLREWSFARVVLTGVGWVVLCVAALVLSIYLQIGGSGSAGIGAVSVGFVDVYVLVPLLPPIVLFVVWLIGRRSRRRM
jgi:hypothetical protein